MSNEVINWALEQEIIGNAPRKFILVLLANRADDAWECWPGERLIAEEAGLSTSQAGKHLLALEEEDHLVLRVPWEREDGGQGANGYVLGNDPRLTSYSFARRGGGRVRVGGFPSTRTAPARGRGAKNPQETTAEKPSDFAAREESRRRLVTKATRRRNNPRTPVPPTNDDFFHAVNSMKQQKPDCYEDSIEAIRSWAPKLWKDAVEKAVKQYKADEPEKVGDQGAVDFLAYQYALVLRSPSWPSWLIGPLLPYLDATNTP